MALVRWSFATNLSLRPSTWRNPTPPTLEQFQEWIVDDSPVDTPNSDLFGHAEIARRMGQRLLAREPSAQALVGKLGSGKSTVSSLVAVWLSGKQDGASVEIVKIELWPYESPRAAVEGVLASVVEALSREVSTSQLEGVPAAYGEAIAKIAGVSEWFPKVLRRQCTPSASLKALDDVATSIGRRYVLWVEDLERFAAGDPNAPAGDSELERLAPIRALLHGLDQLRSITVVTATTDLLRRFDLEKIARHVERIPDLKFRQARRVISAVRSEMLAHSDVIDPTDAAVRMRLGWDDANAVDERTELAFLGDRIGNFAAAVASLATTPRVLKQGLRRAHETWKALGGEIDLDDVIALAILQESHPSVFALLDQRAVGLRTGRTLRRSETSPMDSFMTALREFQLDARTLEAVEMIVKEMFGHEGKRRPQGIAHDNHADYLQRFQSTPELTAGERDQAILRVLRGDDDEKIVDLLVDDRSTAVEDFSHLIPRRRMDGLIVKLTNRLLHADTTKWTEQRPPGLIPLWRMLRTKNRSQTESQALVAQIEQALDLAAPHNLLLMYELAHWLATSVPEVADLLSAELRDRVNTRVRDLFVTAYQDRPRELAAAFRGAPPFLLVWICWTIERVRAKSALGVPFDRWQIMVPTLLDALRASPQLVATQLAGLVVRENRRLGGPDEWLFDEVQCQTLFGDVTTFVEVLRAATAGMEVDARTATVLERKTQPGRDDDDDDGDGDGDGDDEQLTATAPLAAQALFAEAGAKPCANAIPGSADESTPVSALAGS